MLKLAALCVAVLVLAGCTTAAQPDDGLVHVVASTNVYGDLAATIGGDRVEVTSIIDDPSQDPHQFEANGRVQLALSRADVVIVNGGGYDDFATQMLEASGNDDAALIDAVESSGLDATADGFNEHVWYDYDAIVAVVDRIGVALSEADPSGTDAFQAQVDALTGWLQALGDRADAFRAVAEGQGVVITEPVPGYLLDRLGLVNLTPPEFSEAIEEDTDVPAALLQSVLNLLGDGSAALVVYNAQTGGPQTDAVLDIAGENDVAAIGVTETLPEGTGYVAWQTGYLDRIEEALAP